MLNTFEAVASFFQVSPERIRMQYAENAKQLRGLQAKAERTGKKVNGATAEQWNKMASRFEKLASA